MDWLAAIGKVIGNIIGGGGEEKIIIQPPPPPPPSSDFDMNKIMMIALVIMGPILGLGVLMMLVSLFRK
jgi:hypothetical protein